VRKAGWLKLRRLSWREVAWGEGILWQKDLGWGEGSLTPTFPSPPILNNFLNLISLLFYVKSLYLLTFSANNFIRDLV
jgi:hypothetical protein